MLSLALQAFGRPAINFIETRHNFGYIAESEKAVSHLFRFTNSGDSALVIYGIVSGCGCTAADYTSDPIAPGDTGTVTVTYIAEGNPGRFVKGVRVKSNAPPGEMLLTVEGTVIRDDKFKAAGYVCNINGLRLTATRIASGNIEQGKTTCHTVKAINGSDNITVEGITLADNKYFSIRLIGTGNTVRWTKIIGAWTYNCDGISAFAGSTVSNCFVWANDDNIKAYRDHVTFSDMVLWQLNNGGCIQMSWGGAMAANVAIRRVDILHAEWNNSEVNRGVLSCVGDKYQSGKSGYLRYRTSVYSFYGWITDISQKNRINGYTDYKNAYDEWVEAGSDPKTKPHLQIHPTVRWENTIDIKATKFITTTLSFQLYYNRAQNVAVQTQTLLRVGFAYTFKNKANP